jgi:hypothetical protein
MMDPVEEQKYALNFVLKMSKPAQNFADVENCLQ